MCLEVSQKTDCTENRVAKYGGAKMNKFATVQEKMQISRNRCSVQKRKRKKSPNTNGAASCVLSFRCAINLSKKRRILI